LFIELAFIGLVKRL